ncbi:hypothetical protein [Clostridium cadaveris]|uniref:hypothetical protein n=1 Tax=Clostridium cadaveris TaxID=1529 RepID=UPI003994438C
MYNTFKNTFNVGFAKKANGIIYALQKLPLIGKKVPSTLYSHTKLKLTLGVIATVFSVLGRFVGKALYLGVMIMLPAYYINDGMENIYPIFLQMFFFLSLVFGTIMESRVFSGSVKEAFDMIRLMRCEPKKYYLKNIIYKNVVDFIYFMPAMFILGSIIGMSPVKSIILIFEFVALRFISEAMYLFLYSKFSIIFQEKMWFLVPIMFAALATSYGLAFLKININCDVILFNFVTPLILGVLAVMSLMYVIKYKKYTNIAINTLKQQTFIDAEGAVEKAMFAEVTLDEKKMHKEDLNKNLYEDKKGYEYLNALFFRRHMKIIVAPIRIRVIIVGAIFIAGVCLVIFAPESRVDIMKELKEMSPLMVFIMYIMSTGARCCKAMFYNCDASLLRYSYYREKDVILSNFKARLKRIVGLNLIPSVELCIGIVIIVIISGYSNELINLIPLMLSILCLSCFFSIHHLFMYYVLQPYTEQFQVKSPIFSAVNGAIYFISYMCLNIKTASSYFTFIVLGVTIIYMFVALIVTYKVAPKTFKIK